MKLEDEFRLTVLEKIESRKREGQSVQFNHLSSIAFEFGNDDTKTQMKFVNLLNDMHHVEGLIKYNEGYSLTKRGERFYREKSKKDDS